MTQWLPSDTDQDRFVAEGAVRLIRELDATVRRLVRASLLDGHEHTAQVAKAALGVLVRWVAPARLLRSIRLTWYGYAGDDGRCRVASAINAVIGCDQL